MRGLEGGSNASEPLHANGDAEGGFRDMVYKVGILMRFTFTI